MGLNKRVGRKTFKQAKRKGLSAFRLEMASIIWGTNINKVCFIAESTHVTVTDNNNDVMLACPKKIELLLSEYYFFSIFFIHLNLTEYKYILHFLTFSYRLNPRLCI